MANNILGIVLGAAIDRERGESGVKGAVEGYIAEGAIRIIAPIVMTYAIGWGVQYGIRRALHAITGDTDLERGAMSPDVSA